MPRELVMFRNESVRSGSFAKYVSKRALDEYFACGYVLAGVYLSAHALGLLAGWAGGFFVVFGAVFMGATAVSTIKSGYERDAGKSLSQCCVYICVLAGVYMVLRFFVAPEGWNSVSLVVFWLGGFGVFVIILFNGKISKNTLFFNRHGMPTIIVAGCLVALFHARYFDGLSATWPGVALKNPDILTGFSVHFVSWVLFAFVIGIVAFAFGRIVGIMPDPKPQHGPTDDS